MNIFRALSLVVCCGFALQACSTAEEQLGLTKSVPDEFKVVKRAPLELPPSYTLRPPQAGAPRPQEQETVELARDVVLGGAAATQPVRASSSAEKSLLMDAGVGAADPNIRQIIDQETASQTRENQPVVDKILSLGREQAPPSKVVNAKEEAERLKQNQVAGKPVTAGETPSIQK